jgi:hypothetical protein
MKGEVAASKRIYPAPDWTIALSRQDCEIILRAHSLPAWFVRDVLARYALRLQEAIALKKHGNVPMGGFNDFAPLNDARRTVSRRRPARAPTPLRQRRGPRARTPRQSVQRRPATAARGSPSSSSDGGGDEPPPDPEELAGQPVFEILVIFEESRPRLRLWAPREEDERRVLAWIDGVPELRALLEHAARLAEGEQP